MGAEAAMKCAASIPLALLLCATCAAADRQPAVTTFSLPESVLQDPGSGNIFCSNIGGREATADAVAAKDGDGYISLLDPDGNIRDMRFLPIAGEVLNAPKGMAIVGRTLFVADIDRIVGFDIGSRKQIAEFDLSGLKAGFANDLLAVEDGRLLCSDTATGHIFRVDTAESAANDPVGDFVPPLIIPGANGLARDAQGSLLVAQYSFAGDPGKVVRIASWQTGKRDLVALPVPEGQWDGLAVAKDGTVFVSDWKSGAIWSTRDGNPAAIVAKDFKGPADFSLLSDESAILCPDLAAQTVRRITLRR
jgi:hypothetical protein